MVRGMYGGGLSHSSIVFPVRRVAACVGPCPGRANVPDVPEANGDRCVPIASFLWPA